MQSGNETRGGGTVFNKLICNVCTNLLYRTYRVGMAQTENLGAGGHMPLVPPGGSYTYA